MTGETEKERKLRQENERLRIENDALRGIVLSAMRAGEVQVSGRVEGLVMPWAEGAGELVRPD